MLSEFRQFTLCHTEVPNEDASLLHYCHHLLRYFLKLLLQDRQFFTELLQFFLSGEKLQVEMGYLRLMALSSLSKLGCRRVLFQLKEFLHKVDFITCFLGPTNFNTKLGKLAVINLYLSL